MNRLLKLALLAVPLLLQIGCASITGSRNQPISVTTTHEGKPITGAYCTLVNDKGTFYVNTPGTVTVLKAYGDMSATCKKEESHVGVSVFQSANEGAVWGNILAGGIIGYAVDASTGAGFSYPPTLNIEMIRGNVIPALPTSTAKSAPTGQQPDQPVPTTPVVAAAPAFQTQTTTNPTPARSSITPSAGMPPSDLPNPAKRLEELNTMLKKGLISTDDYNTKKAEILRSL
jgi:hypothetical protein